MTQRETNIMNLCRKICNSLKERNIDVKGINLDLYDPIQNKWNVTVRYNDGNKVRKATHLFNAYEMSIESLVNNLHAKIIGEKNDRMEKSMYMLALSFTRVVVGTLIGKGINIINTLVEENPPVEKRNYRSWTLTLKTDKGIIISHKFDLRMNADTLGNSLYDVIINLEKEYGVM